jgi:hypothetical protein
MSRGPSRSNSSMAPGAPISTVLADIVRLEASGWKGENGTAMASDPRMSRFYLDVAHQAARRGMLRLMCLRLDGRLLAFDYSLRSKSTLYNLKVAHDECSRSSHRGTCSRTRCSRKRCDVEVMS